MVDKEQQISESNQMYGQLNQQLEVMLDTIARETDDIKKLETQLNDGKPAKQSASWLTVNPTLALFHLKGFIFKRIFVMFNLRDLLFMFRSHWK